MRREVVELDRFNVTLNELRVKDILMIIASLGEVFDSDVDLSDALSGKRALVVSVAGEFASIDDNKFTLDDITPDELEQLFAPFELLNRDFFTHPTGEGERGAQNPTRTSVEFSASLRESLMSIIASGHAGVLDYPWSLYLDVVKFLNEQSAEES